MFADDEIKTCFGLEKIIKRYPQSGQKEVLLIKHSKFGIAILKIVTGKNERVRREIEIVTNNRFDSVPKVLEVNSFKFNNIEGMYIYEEYIDGMNLADIMIRASKVFS